MNIKVNVLRTAEYKVRTSVPDYTVEQMNQHQQPPILHSC